MTTPRFWREIDERYNLKGMQCGNCGNAFFPARSLCPKCRHASVGKMTPKSFSGEGVVDSFTVVHAPPAGFELQAPYILAIVKLEEGPKVTTQIVDAKPEQVKVGARVKKVFRRINADGESGVIHYGYKFELYRPLRGEGSREGPPAGAAASTPPDPAAPRPRDIPGSGPAG